MRTLLIGVFLALAATSLVWADTEQDKHICLRPTSPQAGIDVCTRLIDRWSDRGIAVPNGRKIFPRIFFCSAQRRNSD
jgi:hypothetical protein